MKKRLIIIGALTMTASLTILAVHLASENPRDVVQPFDRIFIPGQITLLNDVLVPDAAYIAGQVDDRIYIASYERPLVLLDYTNDLSLVKQQDVSVPIGTPSSSIEIEISSAGIYVYDLRVHSVLRGQSDLFSANEVLSRGDFFADAIGLGGRTLALRTWSEDRNEFVLAKKQTEVDRHPELLERQIDGKFCTDGMLRYNPDKQKLIYVYFYRNQFFCMDTSLNLLYRASTIDTTSHVQIGVAEIKSENSITLSTPPRIVNRQCAVWSDFIGIRSTIRSRTDSRRQFDNNSVIDIYSLTDGKYQFSFYIPHLALGQVRAFEFQDDRLFALYKGHLAVYKIPAHWPLN